MSRMSGAEGQVCAHPGDCSCFRASSQGSSISKARKRQHDVFLVSFFCLQVVLWWLSGFWGFGGWPRKKAQPWEAVVTGKLDWTALGQSCTRPAKQRLPGDYHSEGEEGWELPSPECASWGREGVGGWKALTCRSDLAQRQSAPRALADL